MIIDNPILELTSTTKNQFFNVQKLLSTLKIARVTNQSPDHLLAFCQTNDRARPMTNRSELLQRLAPNRLLYVLHSEQEILTQLPLAMLYVALSTEEAVPNRFEQLPKSGPVVDPKTALFYSVSSPWTQVAGLNLGRRLILDSRTDLLKHYPSLKTFCTMSPALTFGQYLVEQGLSQEYHRIQDLDYDRDAQLIAELKPRIRTLAKRYILEEKVDGKPRNAMTRFHLANGAAILRINWPGDLTQVGRKYSAGLLINYIYDPELLNERSLKFLSTGYLEYLEKD